jgi:signal transduction histidine kinase
MADLHAMSGVDLQGIPRRLAEGTQVIQLNNQIVELTEELRQVLGARVPLSTSLAPALGSIQVDPTQLWAAIVDIAAHARDSVPPGGRFVIETRSAALDEHHSDLRGGGYVQLLLTLTGAGMADLRRAHAFVKQTGGHITAESEPGGSTTINFYFPCGSQ